jgi:N-acetylglucosamine-6-sulfatase
MYGYKFNDNGVIRTGGTRPADYQTDVIANRAISMIDQAALQQPFFLSIMPQAVHEEGGLTTYPNPRPAPRHAGIFANRALPRPPSFNEADMSDKGASRPPMTATEIAIIVKKYRSRLETILAVDDLVQRVVDTLATKGLMQNTVVMLTSDNGYYYGEHRKPDGKGGFYPEATHMPLYILGPMFPDTIARQFVSNVDLASTITDLANAVPGLPQDGRSLLPLALNPAASINRSVLIEQLGFKSVINDAYLYAEKAGGTRELYDLREGEATYDPYQIQSRHRDPAYSAVQTQLSQKVRSLSVCDGAACLQ